VVRGCGLSRNIVSGECFSDDPTSSSSSEEYTNVIPVAVWSVRLECVLVSALADDDDVLGLDSSESFELSREPSLALENISLLNASTPRSTSAVRTGVADEDEFVFVRKGLRSVLDGPIADGGANS